MFRSQESEEWEQKQNLEKRWKTGKQGSLGSSRKKKKVSSPLFSLLSLNIQERQNETKPQVKRSSKYSDTVWVSARYTHAQTNLQFPKHKPWISIMCTPSYFCNIIVALHNTFCFRLASDHNTFSKIIINIPKPSTWAKTSIMASRKCSQVGWFLLALLHPWKTFSSSFSPF